MTVTERIEPNRTIIDFCQSKTFVIIDGCDGVGKSTIAAHIEEQMRWLVRHADYQPDVTDVYEYYRSVLSDAKDTAFDRSFTSEVVYGVTLRERSRLRPDQTQMLVELVAAHHGGFIHVHATPDTVIERLAARPGPQHDRTVIRQLLDRFDDLFADLAQVVPVLQLDTT